MTADTQEDLVGRQFGPTAQAYLTSAVHSEGEDLRALAALFAAAGDMRVLDLGCGAGHASFRIAPHVGEITAYDLSPEMLEVVAKSAAERGLANLRTERGRAEKLPFADASFDAVVSRYSAHHWGDLDAALRETARVLKPGGLAAFIDTVSPGQPLRSSSCATPPMSAIARAPNGPTPSPAPGSCPPPSPSSASRSTFRPG